jgi:hypothetical protein
MHYSAPTAKTPVIATRFLGFKFGVLNKIKGVKKTARSKAMFDAE